MQCRILRTKISFYYSFDYCFTGERKILVMHRSGPRTNEAVELVGYIRVDLDTPTPVLREFIRRFCGGWLNEHAKVGRARENKSQQHLREMRPTT